MSRVLRTLLDVPGAEALQTTRWLALLLWAGLAVLTVSLIVLMRTRWGQARPLSKCVVLSLFAHVLFAAYAYGTRLFFDVPVPAHSQMVRLTMVDAACEEERLDERDMAPWNELASSELAPGLEQPEAVRADTSFSPQLADAAAATPEAPTFEVSMHDRGAVRRRPAAGEGAAPVEPAWSPAPEVSGSTVQATPLEAPQTRPAPKPPPRPRVSTPAPRRADTQDVPVAPPADMAQTPSELLDMTAPVQRLADAVVPTERAEAVPSIEDTTQAASNRQAAAVPPAATSAAADDSPAGPQPAAGSTQVHDPLAARPAPRRLADGQPLPELYRARMEDVRLAIARRNGGDENTEQAVQDALQWLVKQQQPDGRWSARQLGAGQENKVLGHDRGGAGAEADTAVTGLALLALLGAGQTHFEGEHRVHVQRGLEFLIGIQHSDGSLAGQARLFARMYCHGMASLAISEAYAMTGDKRLRPFVERAVQYTVRAQDPYSGGWRYQVGDRRGDMSQFGWQVMVLKSAELAGVPTPEATREGLLRFLDSASAGTHRGLASYRPGEQPTGTMTAEALACRFFLRLDPSEMQRQEAAELISRQLPASGLANYYYWYYGTLAMFQQQGERWEAWNEALKRELLSRQRHDGRQAGSWDADSIWGGYGGRVYTTAMAALCLEVYYRYLPLYE